jgi:hypothetical protein
MFIEEKEVIKIDTKNSNYITRVWLETLDTLVSRYFLRMI